MKNQDWHATINWSCHLLGFHYFLPNALFLTLNPIPDGPSVIVPAQAPLHGTDVQTLFGWPRPCCGRQGTHGLVWWFVHDLNPEIFIHLTSRKRTSHGPSCWPLHWPPGYHSLRLLFPPFCPSIFGGKAPCEPILSGRRQALPPWQHSFYVDDLERFRAGGYLPPLTDDGTDSGHPLPTPSSDAVLHRAAQGLPQLLHLVQLWGSLLVQTAVVCLALTAHQSHVGPPVDHRLKSARPRGARSCHICVPPLPEGGEGSWAPPAQARGLPVTWRQVPHCSHLTSVRYTGYN